MNGKFERDDSLGLGEKAKDEISGYKGVIVALTEWLNGCRRITIQCEELFEGKPIENQTFDAEQVSRVGKKPTAGKAPSRTGGPSIAPKRAVDPV